MDHSPLMQAGRRRLLVNMDFIRHALPPPIRSNQRTRVPALRILCQTDAITSGMAALATCAVLRHARARWGRRTAGFQLPSCTRSCFRKRSRPLRRSRKSI